MQPNDQTLLAAKRLREVDEKYKAAVSEAASETKSVLSDSSFKLIDGCYMQLIHAEDFTRYDLHRVCEAVVHNEAANIPSLAVQTERNLRKQLEEKIVKLRHQNEAFRSRLEHIKPFKKISKEAKKILGQIYDEEFEGSQIDMENVAKELVEHEVRAFAKRVIESVTDGESPDINEQIDPDDPEFQAKLADLAQRSERGEVSRKELRDFEFEEALDAIAEIMDGKKIKKMSRREFAIVRILDRLGFAKIQDGLCEQVLES